MVNRRELLWLLGHQQTIGMSVVSSSTGCCCRHVLLRHDRAATAAAERLLVGAPTSLELTPAATVDTVEYQHPCPESHTP